jgi:AcrR family transcriptional regulator
MGLREEHTRRRRERILAAVRELIDRDGVDGWSMRKVARAANLSVPTLYNLFGSKDEIRSALCAGFFDEIDQDLQETSLDRPLERALTLATEGVDHVVAQAAMTRPILLAGEQINTHERRTTSAAVERSRAAIQAAMDQGYLYADLRADLLAAEVYDGFYRAALLWARGELDATGFRMKALYAVCVCLLAVATDATRPELLRTTRRLERKLARKPRRRVALAG